MGCTSSKLDDLPAVALCRERCAFLDEAITLRFALAEAHVAYIHSLRGIGHSLHHFINQNHQLNESSTDHVDSPKLHLPHPKKIVADNDSPKKKDGITPSHSHSHSHSGSHLQFNSDDEDDDDDEDDSGGSNSLHHHSDDSSPLHHNHHLGDGGGAGGGGYGGHIQYVDSGYANYPHTENMGMYNPGGGGGGGYMHMNYMKKQATPSTVVYQQRPISPERVYMGESSSSSSSYYPYPYNSNPTFNTNQYSGYPNYGVGGGGGSGGGYVSGYYGSSSSPPRYGSQAAVDPSSKPPPPPPSPPRASAWEYLNLFQSYDKYYPPYTPSRDSKDLREEEGIPDLEDEDFEHEVVKEVHGEQKFGHGDGNHPKSVPAGEDTGEAASVGTSGGKAEAEFHMRPQTVAMENEGVEYEVHVMEKKVVDNERNEDRRSSAPRGGGGGGGGAPLDVSDVATAIEVQFVKASESGNEIAKMLEAGKLPYHRKHVSKMLHVVTPSLSVLSSQPSTSRSAETQSSADNAGPSFLEFEEEVAMMSGNLSSSLQKLLLWEKKLSNEVKAEEKMRVAHDRKVRKLKRLDERGAESHKIDSTRAYVRSLSTKIRIAIQVVDKISVTINKIRDEELWPQLNELIQGLTRMWKCMLECHRNQCQSIREARGLGPIRSGKKLSDAHLEATRQLEYELVNCTLSFSNWIGVQKRYVKALNDWLLKCLLYVPEETADGIVPFSPGRIGAPPVFVICNQWSQALNRISEDEVVQSLRVLTMSVLQLWEQDKLEIRQKMAVDKDLERKGRHSDKEEQKIHKEIQALEKKMVLASGDGTGLSVAGNAVFQSDTSSNSLQGSLLSIFEAMEKFSEYSMKAYEELLQRAEEEKAAQERERNS